MKKWWIIALVLAGVLAWMVFNPMQRPEVPKGKPVPVEQGGMEQLLAAMDPRQELEQKPDYRSIMQRPVFFSLRRVPDVYVPPKPKVKRKPVVKKKPTRKPNIHLSGIIRIGARKYALVSVSGAKNKGAQRVQVGDEIEDWKVMKIGKDSITVRLGVETMELMLRSYKPVLPAKAAPAAGSKPQQPRQQRGRNLTPVNRRKSKDLRRYPMPPQHRRREPPPKGKP